MGRAIDVDNRLDVVEARLKKTEKLKDTKKFKGYMEKKYDKPEKGESKDRTSSLISDE